MEQLPCTVDGFELIHRFVSVVAVFEREAVEAEAGAEADGGFEVDKAGGGLVELTS